MRSRVLTLSSLALAALSCLPATAQWLHQNDPRVPRDKNGKPDLAAPAPKTADGKPDLSGVWIRREGENAPPNSAGLGFSLKWFMPKSEEIPLRPAAMEIYKPRVARDGGGRPSESCLPHGVPGAMMPPTPFKFVQTPGLTLILYETWVDFRQIFTDGRKLPESPEPTWYGYSIGHWEGDTFVVETKGFNDQVWIDGLGLPHSSDLKITERFQRLSAGHLRMVGTIDDPKMYTKPWNFTMDFNLIHDSDLIEYICENEKDSKHYGEKK